MFGERLSSEMEKARLSQKDLADAAGCSQAAISRYLCGRIPKAAELFALSKLLGVSMEWLLVGGENTEPVQGKTALEGRASQLEVTLRQAIQQTRDLLALLEKKV